MNEENHQTQEPKEPKEKKKPLLLVKIIRWIWIVLLSLLLAVGLFFQAPWKVLTLFLIFLLAATALPRPYRKWFWAGVGCVVIAIVIWVFLPDSSEGWRPYTFDEELAALEAARAVPDKQNAALIYNRLLSTDESFEPNIPDPNTYFLTRKEMWTSNDYPQVAEWLKKHQTTIEILKQACQKDKCSFPINADILGISKNMDRLSTFRQWAYLLICAANNDIAEDRFNEGLYKYSCVIKMADHIRQDPEFTSLLVANATSSLAISQLKKVVVSGKISPEQVETIDAALSEIKYDWYSDFRRCLDVEKLMAKNFWGVFYEVNEQGKVRRSRNPAKHMFSRLQDEEIEIEEQIDIAYTYWIQRADKLNAIQAWFWIPADPQQVSKVIDKSYERLYAMAEPDYDWSKQSWQFTWKTAKLNFPTMINMLTAMLDGAYHKISDLYPREISNLKGARVVVVLRRYKNKYGQWPDRLDDVKESAKDEIFIDAHNNPFVYRLTDDGFMLYSKGKNGIDEGGQYDDGWPVPKTGADDRLIWPPKKSMEKKEDPNDTKVKDTD